ncbi:MAG: glutaminyl-peptide cyclotransferase [Deltaproteobacteria bacterium]|nr:glutaminyl-peptide cyclotransferase [Deltaproteobacteria bacterium]
MEFLIRVLLFWLTLAICIGIISPFASESSTVQVRLAESPPSLGQKTVDCNGFTADPVYSYRIVNIYPHDRGAFTQGLAFQGGTLFEGTGRYGKSSLRKVEVGTGKILNMVRLPHRYFGEGVTVFGDKVIQLTWKSRVGFIYREKDLALVGKFRYRGQGWGITHDGLRLIMSDGTSSLRFLDPFTLKELGRVEVQYGGAPVTNINELEYIRGRVYANLWGTDCIVIIDPGSGQVEGWIHLPGLLAPEDMTSEIDVLNGIAYDPRTDRLLFTGKLWPKLFEIKIME